MWRGPRDFERRLRSYLKEVRRAIAKGADREDVLVTLRTRGANKAESIIVLTEIEGLSIDEAKRAVQFSLAWEDVREADEKLQEDLAKAASRLSDSDGASGRTRVAKERTKARPARRGE